MQHARRSRADWFTIAAMLEELDHLAQRQQLLIDSLRQVQHDHAEAGRRLQAMQSERDRLGGQLERAGAELQSLRTEHSRLEADNQRLRTLLVTTQQQVDAVLARLPDPDSPEPDETASHASP